ncbi:hypothetical protein KIN20_004682, partial [Parelaphostrongylus tenuis]
MLEWFLIFLAMFSLLRSPQRSSCCHSKNVCILMSQTKVFETFENINGSLLLKIYLYSSIVIQIDPKATPEFYGNAQSASRLGHAIFAVVFAFWAYKIRST